MGRPDRSLAAWSGERVSSLPGRPDILPRRHTCAARPTALQEPAAVEVIRAQTNGGRPPAWRRCPWPSLRSASSFLGASLGGRTGGFGARERRLGSRRRWGGRSGRRWRIVLSARWRAHLLALAGDNFP